MIKFGESKLFKSIKFFSGFLYNELLLYTNDLKIIFANLKSTF